MAFLIIIWAEKARCLDIHQSQKMLRICRLQVIYCLPYLILNFVFFYQGMQMLTDLFIPEGCGFPTLPYFLICIDSDNFEFDTFSSLYKSALPDFLIFLHSDNFESGVLFPKQICFCTSTNYVARFSSLSRT